MEAVTGMQTVAEDSPAAGVAVDSPADAHARLVAFMRGFSVETTPGGDAKVADYRAHLPGGATVAITHLPGADWRDGVRVAARLRREGFEPAPHVAARSMANLQELNEFLARLAGEAGVREAVALAGSVAAPVGPFDSSMALLETGLFDKHGIARLGVAGHPEGNRDIGDDALAAALRWKNDFAARTDAKLYLVTQFVFDAAPLLAWARAINHAGNALPIHAGIPGPATLKTLIHYARACGVGASMKFLTRQARHVAKLLALNTPDKLLLDLAAAGPAAGITRAHFYPLGGLRRTALLAGALAAGRFTVAGDALQLTDPLP